MSEPMTRSSPIQHLLESRGAEFRNFGGSSYVVRSNSERDDQRTLELLGLCDLSGLQKLGLRGPHAEAWLTTKGIDVPSDLFATRSLPDGGVIVRVGADEFFLEDDIANTALPAFSAQIDSHEDLVRVDHQEATFLLTGCRSLKLLAQTCGINIREAVPHEALYTRVAGVSCGVLPETRGDLPAYRLWVDPSYAVYLWETLVEICGSLEGGEIGAGCIYPEVLS